MNLTQSEKTIITFVLDYNIHTLSFSIFSFDNTVQGGVIRLLWPALSTYFSTRMLWNPRQGITINIAKEIREKIWKGRIYWTHLRIYISEYYITKITLPHKNKVIIWMTDHAIPMYFSMRILKPRSINFMHSRIYVQSLKLLLSRDEVMNITETSMNRQFATLVLYFFVETSSTHLYSSGHSLRYENLRLKSLGDANETWWRVKRTEESPPYKDEN